MHIDRLSLGLLLPLLLTACPSEPASEDDWGSFEGGETTTTTTTDATTDAEESNESSNAECGNGTVEGDEECDLGDDNDDAGQCTSACMIAACGDGFVYAGFEECDDGNTSNTDACVQGCKVASCGDGFVQQGVEPCDDGNDVETDDCTMACTPANCGDGIIQDGEQCDDGDMDTADECPACQLAFCGDGYIQAGIEVCDDGNLESNDGCIAPLCIPAECGDGHVYEGMEECDDGNTEATDACTDVCGMPYCGDGIKHEGVEECDDGNADNDDGCDDQCIAHGDPQCFLPYTSLNLANRNVTAVNQIVICDQNGGDGQFTGLNWYRFEGAAGTMMPEVAPQEYACGTHAPGWLNGAHPDLADGPVQKQVCFHWSGNNCLWNTMITVVACPDFYLYQLPNTPVCSLRYCGTN